MDVDAAANVCCVGGMAGNQSDVQNTKHDCGLRDIGAVQEADKNARPVVRQLVVLCRLVSREMTESLT